MFLNPTKLDPLTPHHRIVGELGPGPFFPFGSDKVSLFGNLQNARLNRKIFLKYLFSGK